MRSTILNGFICANTDEIARECCHSILRYFKYYVNVFQPVSLRVKNHEQWAFYDIGLFKNCKPINGLSRI